MNIFEKLASDINASVSEKLAKVTGMANEKVAVSIDGVLRKLNNQLAIGSIGSKKLIDAGMPMSQAQSFTIPGRTNARANAIFDRLTARATHGNMSEDVLSAINSAKNRNNSAYTSAIRDTGGEAGVDTGRLQDAYARRFGATTINPTSRSASPAQQVNIPPASPEMDKNRLLRQLLSHINL